ncbi:hypothetical protein [Streptomyces sp. NPDC046985]|uniref:hypothetical protein n=1 Tax=Streptomyces sp. NPDC046985 TaxID=3155377 RepID=UPI0033E6EC22
MTAASNPQMFLAAADRLTSAIERHALALAQDPDDPAEVVPAADAVTEAAREYADAVFDATGWGSPFVQTEQEDEHPRPAADAPRDIRVKTDYVLRAKDVRAAAGVLRRRRAVTGRPGCDDLGDDLSDIVHALFLIDGWDPGSYGEAIEAVGQEWSAGPSEE